MHELHEVRQLFICFLPCFSIPPCLGLETHFLFTWFWYTPRLGLEIHMFYLVQVCPLSGLGNRSVVVTRTAVSGCVFFVYPKLTCGRRPLGLGPQIVPHIFEPCGSHGTARRRRRTIIGEAGNMALRDQGVRFYVNVTGPPTRAHLI